MDLELRGHRALVTGSTAGIGFAIALRLAREGARVWVSGRTAKRVEQAIKEITREVPEAKVEGVAADAGTASGAEKLLQAVPDLDILVNNVGVYEPKSFTQIDDSDWQRLLDVNLMSGVRLSRYYLPRMLTAKAGRIIFISSESALQIPVEMIHYGVTKTAQAALARGLAEMTVGTPVTVNSVLAGPTRSEGVDQFIAQLSKERGISEADMERDFFTTARPSSLLRRFATTDEVASVVAFVASGKASAINGSAIRAEGGVLRSVF